MEKSLFFQLFGQKQNNWTTEKLTLVLNKKTKPQPAGDPKGKI